MPALRIPLTVIGGFLGAGKTTLLNHMLSMAGEQGRRLAVLVNDFGAINLDQSLIASHGGETLELTNGCVCCQIGDDLSTALIALIESPRPPEAIVIEASGVSDPWRIAQVGIADPALTLDGVIVLLDAAALPTQAADPLLTDSVLRQLRSADLLVLNKCDLVAPADLASLRSWLDAQVPGRPRYETSQSRVPAPMLGLGLSPALHVPAATGALGHSPRWSASAPDHGTLFDTWVLPEVPLLRAAQLRSLLKNMPAGVLRLKGLVRTDEHAMAELQFAGLHGSLRPANRTVPTTSSCVIAIGLRGQLPGQALSDAFEAAVVRDEATLPS